MKKFASYKLIALVLLLMVVYSCHNDNDSLILQEDESLFQYEYEPIEGQYIVVLNGTLGSKPVNLKYEAMKKQMKTDIKAKFSNINIEDEAIVQTYGYTLNGFAAKLSPEQLEGLQKDDRVAYVEQDYLVTLGKPSWAGGGGSEEPSSQDTPWGITRVNGGASYSGSGVAWVIDSGIDLDHPDLNVDTSRSASFLGGKDANNPDDANGHGTHVAGTIAAVDNDFGVVGVAAGAAVVSVRVLDRRGSGAYSGVIAGVDYVKANGQSGDVANMSLGGPVSQALDDAVLAASSKVKFVIAAGNSSADANNYSPARVNGSNIYTISASDVNDNFASFSNYGTPVDFCAPGVNINSTWKSGGYNAISGTSMAAPHAAGVLLAGSPRTDGTVNGDPDGKADSIIVR